MTTTLGIAGSPATSGCPSAGPSSSIDPGVLEGVAIIARQLGHRVEQHVDLGDLMTALHGSIEVDAEELGAVLRSDPAVARRAAQRYGGAVVERLRDPDAARSERRPPVTVTVGHGGRPTAGPGSVTVTRRGSASGVQGGSVSVRVAPPRRPSVTVRTASPEAVTRSRSEGMQRAASQASSGADYSFLNDPSLDIEAKMMMFFATALSDFDNKIEKLMARHAQLDAAKNGGGDTKQGGRGLRKLLRNVGSAAVRFGAPLAGAAIESEYGVAGARDAGTQLGAQATGSTDGQQNAAQTDEGSDEMARIMAEIQLLSNRRQQIASMLTNVMAANHQTRMGFINNIKG